MADTIDGMRAFKAVFESGGFAAAARRMGLSRSAVNRYVMQLEDELGTRLFTRSTRQVTPTETGRAFYGRCERILEDLDEAMALVGELQERPKGTLRVNAPMSFGTLHLTEVVADFMREYPEVHVELVLNDRPIDPIEEGFDVTVRIGEITHSTSLITHELGTDARVMCASPGYLERAGEPISPTELKHHRCLHYGYQDSGSQWRLVGPSGAVSYDVQCAMWSNNGEVLRDAAILDQGIVLLPSFIVFAALRDGRLVKILGDFPPSPLQAAAIYPRHRSLTAKLKAFLECLDDTSRRRAWFDA